MSGGKVYSFDEVRKHRDRKDCWLIISGKVYDVTPFMDEHPGGDEVLLACTGKDATADFDDIGHTESAKELMPQYCIGKVDATSVPAKPTHAVPTKETAATTRARGTSPGAVWLTVVQLAVPVLLLVVAFALQSYVKTKTE